MNTQPEYIRFEVVDFNGKALSKTLPARHRDSRVYMCSASLTMGANAEVIEFPEELASRGCPNVRLLPDWSTEQLLPWAHERFPVRRVYCEQSAVQSEAEKNPAVPRTICARLLQELRAFESQGLELMAGGELEFILAKRAGDAWQPLFEGVDIFATLQNEKAMDFCYEVEQNMQKVGVDVLTMNAEYGPGQMEISFAPKIGLPALDAAATFRTGVKEMAVKRGMRACFMGKPFGSEGPGSGGHFNFSLWTPWTGEGGAGDAGDAAAGAGAGRSNAFYEKGGLSPLAWRFLAGVVRHAAAMEAVCSPTPSCYLRRGRWAPQQADWGLEDRRAYLRLKAGQRPTDCYMELRAPSAAACPYLVAACVVAAGMEGLQKGLELPQEPPKLPASLPEALEALEQDDWMREKLGPDFVRWYCLVKRGEMRAVAAREEVAGDVGEAWRHVYMEFV